MAKQRYSAYICKEEPDDVNNFTKTFAHILNFEFYRPYYILQIFLFSYLFNAWLYFTNNNLNRRLSSSNHVPKATHQTKPKNFSDKFTSIRDRCRFLQTGPIYFMIFEKKLGLSNVNQERMYKLCMDFIPNDWKHLATLN